jgi:hypothetical protein
MRALSYFSKNRHFERSSRILRRISKKYKKETDGFLLIANAIDHLEHRDIDSAIEEIERFEQVCITLRSEHRALLGSVKANLKRCNRSKLFDIFVVAVVGMFLKVTLGAMWDWLVSKTQISENEINYRTCSTPWGREGGFSKDPEGLSPTV